MALSAHHLLSWVAKTCSTTTTLIKNVWSLTCQTLSISVENTGSIFLLLLQISRWVLLKFHIECCNNETSAPIGAWKCCDFLAFNVIMTDRLTDKPNNWRPTKHKHQNDNYLSCSINPASDFFMLWQKNSRWKNIKLFF